AAALRRGVDGLEDELRAAAAPGVRRERGGQSLDAGLGIAAELRRLLLRRRVGRGREADLADEPELPLDELVPGLRGDVEDVMVAAVGGGEWVDPGRIEVAEVVLALRQERDRPRPAGVQPQRVRDLGERLAGHRRVQRAADQPR